MPRSSKLFFVSSNKNKFEEAKKILNTLGIDSLFSKQKLQEIQSNSIKKIAKFKAENAFSKLKKPLIIEDDGLFITALDGFPGPYSSYVFQKIGNKGILQLLKKNRKAKFVSIITYFDGKIMKTFEANLFGKISHKPKGKGWGYDPIFCPHNSSKTFAELKNKNELSHRFLALKKFSNWYIQESNDR